MDMERIYKQLVSVFLLFYEEIVQKKGLFCNEMSFQILFICYNKLYLLDGYRGYLKNGQNRSVTVIAEI